MGTNSNLNQANKAKKDEFYTDYDDIQAELNHYEAHFRGKTVLCNCDDPFESNFCKFFLLNFNYLGLKRLICTSYGGSSMVGKQLSIFDDADEPLAPENGYVMDIREVPMENGRGVSEADVYRLLTSKKRGVKKLKDSGDFRSDECIKYLKQADIVVTNPPFSLFREYVAQLMEYDKKFIILGDQNAITYKEIFPLIAQNRLWLGYNNGGTKWFRVPLDYDIKTEARKKRIDGIQYFSMGRIFWYTNLDIRKRHESLILYRNYDPQDYPRYDNYDAINVDKVSEIPVDYDGVMGVPITFVDKYSPDQFVILGCTESEGKGFSNGLWYADSKVAQPLVKKQRIYKRIFIKKR